MGRIMAILSMKLWPLHCRLRKFKKPPKSPEGGLGEPEINLVILNYCSLAPLLRRSGGEADKHYERR